MCGLSYRGVAGGRPRITVARIYIRDPISSRQLKFNKVYGAWPGQENFLLLTTLQSGQSLSWQHAFDIHCHWS